MPIPAPANRHLPPEPKGWPLLPVPDAGALVAFSPLGRSVIEQIKIILLTRPGELLLHPEFGVGLEDYLHAPNTVATRRRIQDAIRAGVERFEERIVLDRVEVIEVTGSPERLRVELAWRLRRTGAPATLGLEVRLET